MHQFRNLEVWRLARAAAVRIYALTKSLPKDERYGLVSQLRRAAISVASNIVEGSKRSTAEGFAYFLTIAEGSAGEIWTILDVLPELDIGDYGSAPSDIAAQYLVIEKKLHALRRHVDP